MQSVVPSTIGGATLKERCCSCVYPRLESVLSVSISIRIDIGIGIDIIKTRIDIDNRIEVGTRIMIDINNGINICWWVYLVKRAYC